MVFTIATGFATSTIFFLLGMYGVIYYNFAASISIALLSISSGIALSEGLRKLDIASKPRFGYSICLAMAILVFGYFLLQWVPFHLMDDPIAVSPNEIELINLFDPLPDKKLRGKIDINVYNRGDDPYYQIWVKIVIESTYLSASNIGLDFPTLESRIKAGEESSYVSTEAWCVRGFDKKKKEMFLCFVSSINPKQTFQIKMTSDFRPASDQLGRALLKVVSFEKRPSLRSENARGDTKGGFSAASPPEDFTLEHFIVLCPDIGKPRKFTQQFFLCTPNSMH